MSQQQGTGTRSFLNARATQTRQHTRATNVHLRFAFGLPHQRQEPAVILSTSTPAFDHVHITCEWCEFPFKIFALEEDRNSHQIRSDPREHTNLLSVSWIFVLYESNPTDSQSMRSYWCEHHP